ncbi:MAG: hypothetical protein RLY93_05695 [Sumerlaeia bacterium]
MTPEQLAERHPRFYHMAEVEAWPSIRRHGLLSACALAELFELTGDDLDRAVRRYRPKCLTLTHPVHGEAILRDQHPMPPGKIRKVIPATWQPEDWYFHVNGHAFLWPSEDRLGRIRQFYSDRDSIVLVVDANRLLARHAGAVRLSPINSGSIPSFVERDDRTYRPLADFPDKNEVAEIVVPVGIPDIADHVLRIDRIRGSETLGTMWERA